MKTVKLTRQFGSFCFPLPWKGVHYKGKEYAPLESKFFPFKVDSFEKGVHM